MNPPRGLDGGTPDRAALRVRLAQPGDLTALVELGAQADPRVYSLPRSRADLARLLERSTHAAASAVDVPGEEHYLLVLEEDGQLRGSAALRATAGSGGTYFAFRNDLTHHVSRDLRISNNVHILTLVSDLTDSSQLLSFMLAPDCRSVAAGGLLSRARLMLARLAPQRFAARFFAALAGQCDDGMGSPFWDAIGRQFFNMDFLAAERAVAGERNVGVMVELMPHYPIYVPLLPAAARDAIGQMHAQARLTQRILSAEGFRSETFVDVFDGGPIFDAPVGDLRTLATAQTAQVQVAEPPDGTPHWLIAPLDAVARFRCVEAPVLLDIDQGTAQLSPALCRRLDVVSGDPLLLAPA